MAYDESLAARVRQSLAGRPDVEEKPMFGGLTFMVAGNMCCGVNRDDLIIRLDAGTAVEDLHSPQVRAWDFCCESAGLCHAEDGRSLGRIGAQTCPFSATETEDRREAAATACSVEFPFLTEAEEGRESSHEAEYGRP